MMYFVLSQVVAILKQSDGVVCRPSPSTVMKSAVVPFHSLAEFVLAKAILATSSACQVFLDQPAPLLDADF
jgi:hypothetical protein